MIFKLEEEHLSVKEAAREFAKTRLKEGVIERDISMAYPTEFVKFKFRRAHQLVYLPG